ncbi:hypothetical protein [Sphingomonas koreensis]|nr:hypothetical protein [Sphingomonas koreensis]
MTTSDSRIPHGDASLPFIHPDDMPDLYALTGRGTYMMPLIDDGAVLVMDKNQIPSVGDTVALTFTREAAQRYHMPGMLKRLAYALPPAEFAELGLIVVEQLTPHRLYTFPVGDVLAVHKCIGFAESSGVGEARYRPSQESPRATAEMLERCIHS